MMDISAVLPAGLGQALVPPPNIDPAQSGDELEPLLYVPQQPEISLQLPVPAPALELAASNEPQPAQNSPELQADPLSLPVVDPEQWLNVMLDQHAVQLQARVYASDTGSGLPGERALARTAAEARRQDLFLDGAQAMHVASLASVRKEGDSESKPPVFALDKSQSLFSKEQVFDEQQLRFSKAQPPAPLHAGVQTAVSALVEMLPGTEVPVPAVLLSGSAAGSEPVLERGLKLAAPQARWGEQMLHALRETVEVQVQQRFQQATIRLDPPELGSLEIFISHESGRLSVHISAAQTDVARLLVSTSDRLRQELVEQNNLQVQVQVSSDSQGHSQRDRGRSAREPAVADAIQDAQVPAASLKQRDSDVLVTV